MLTTNTTIDDVADMLEMQTADHDTCPFLDEGYLVIRKHGILLAELPPPFIMILDARQVWSWWTMQQRFNIQGNPFVEEVMQNIY